MCASYGALESTFVSTRSTVPDTLASAAARTLAAASPLSSVSVLPLTVWPPCDGSRGGCPLGAWAADGDDEDDAVEDVAALAMAAPPPASRAPVGTSNRRSTPSCFSRPLLVRDRVGIELADAGPASTRPSASVAADISRRCGESPGHGALAVDERPGRAVRGQAGKADDGGGSFRPASATKPPFAATPVSMTLIRSGVRARSPACR